MLSRLRGEREVVKYMVTLLYLQVYCPVTMFWSVAYLNIKLCDYTTIFEMLIVSRYTYNRYTTHIEPFFKQAYCAKRIVKIIFLDFHMIYCVKCYV